MSAPEESAIAAANLAVMLAELQSDISLNSINLGRILLAKELQIDDRFDSRLSKSGKPTFGVALGELLKIPILRKSEILCIGNKEVKLKEKIAEGGYGAVYRCKDRQENKYYALKRCRFYTSFSSDALMINQEIKVLRQIGQFSNIISLVGYNTSVETGVKNSEQLAQIDILLEWCPGGTLTKHLDVIANLSIDDAARWEFQILWAFAEISRSILHLHMQEPPVIHCDLKPDNILLGYNGHFKLCDFGSCMTGVKSGGEQVYESEKELSIAEEHFSRYTSASIRPPEMWDLYRREEIGPTVDSWGLGCILYALTSGKMPFTDEDKLAVLNCSYSIPDRVRQSKKLSYLISKLLQEKPQDRMTSAELCQDLQEYLNDFIMARNAPLPQDEVSIKGNEPTPMDTERVLVVPAHEQSSPSSQTSCDSPDSSGEEPEMEISPTVNIEKEDCSDSQISEVSSQNTNGDHAECSADTPDIQSSSASGNKEALEENLPNADLADKVADTDVKLEEELTDSDTVIDDEDDGNAATPPEHCDQANEDFHKLEETDEEAALAHDSEKMVNGSEIENGCAESKL